MIGDPRTVRPLIEALADADHGVRNMAAGALRRIGKREGLEAVRTWTSQRRSARAARLQTAREPAPAAAKLG